MQIQRLIADPFNHSGKFNENLFQDPLSFKREFQMFLKQSEERDVGENQSNSHCKEIIQNLWSILDNEIDTQMIVD